MSDTDAENPLGFTPRLTTHPVDVGLRSEAAILSRLVKAGYPVLLPFGVNQRYDLVLDLDGRFVRVQCKSGRLRGGAVEFSTQSVRANTSETFSRGYVGEIDTFAVYCPGTDGVYLVPIEEAPRRRMHLRVDRTLNAQDRRVNWARKYELPG